VDIDLAEPEEIKADIYEGLAVINRAFRQIIGTIRKLQTNGIVSEDYVQDNEIIANDLWARINSHLLTKITERELDDRNHYGKMRATMERRIRGRQ
jgi:hypothetical protein